jgi:hypothetical protein
MLLPQAKEFVFYTENHTKPTGIVDGWGRSVGGIGGQLPRRAITVSHTCLNWLIDRLWWGETDVSELRPSLAYCLSPSECVWRVVMTLMDNWLVYQSSLAVLPAEPSAGVGGIDEGMRIVRIQYLWYVNVSFTCRKILRHGTSGFTSNPKEGVLVIFISLKNPSPRPGFNPRPLGTVTSTLTTTPQRRHVLECDDEDWLWRNRQRQPYQRVGVKCATYSIWFLYGSISGVTTGWRGWQNVTIPGPVWAQRDPQPRNLKH